MIPAFSANGNGIFQGVDGGIQLAFTERQVAPNKLDDHMLAGLGAFFDVFEQWRQVAGCGLGLVLFPVDFNQRAVLPAGDQPRLAGVGIVFVYPLPYPAGGFQGKVGVAPVVLDPRQQPAGRQHGAGFSFHLAVIHGAFQGFFGLVQLALAEIIHAQAVVGDGLQGNADLVDVLEHLPGQVRGVLLVVSAAGKVRTHQRYFTVNGQGAFGIRVRVRHPAVQQVFHPGQQRFQPFYPVGEEQTPDLEHLQLRAVVDDIRRDFLQPFQYRQMETAVDQVVAVLREHPGQALGVFALDNLADGFLHLAMAEQPVDGAGLHQLCPGGVFALNALQQGFPEQVMVAEPLVTGVQRNQEQVLGQ